MRKIIIYFETINVKIKFYRNKYTWEKKATCLGRVTYLFWMGRAIYFGGKNKILAWEKQQNSKEYVEMRIRNIL